ncbi:MAG: hypothetical protein LKM44_01655 [Wolbachia endosymbiont of Meromenopon meropis]|nr:hypothetical protein [Wolbachia endosymbiont of Meromenopon meropis]
MSKSKMIEKLVKAFNADNHFYEIIDTNLTLEREWNGDFIVIRFCKGINHDQCMRYMNDLRSKMIKRFFINESDASIAFNIKAFPFFLKKKNIQLSKEGMKYVTPVNEGIVFNLKCYLMFSFAKDIEGKLGKIFGVEYIDNLITSEEFDQKYYLYSTDFGNKKVRDKFIELFQSDIASYGKIASELFEVEDNCVRIRDIFGNNTMLIHNIMQRNLWFSGRYLETPISKNKLVEAVKIRIVDLIDARLNLTVHSILRAPYLDSKEDTILIPIVKDCGGFFRLLYQKETSAINEIFDFTILNNVDKCIPEDYLINLLGEKSYRTGVYGIDFYDKKISCCVMSKLIEESVVNIDGELEIDSILSSHKKKQYLQSNPPSSIDEGASVCTSLLRSTNFSFNKSPCNKSSCALLNKNSEFLQESHERPSSVILENHLTEFTDQQVILKKMLSH